MSATAHQLADAVSLLERGVFDAQRREKAATEELRAREELIDSAQKRKADVQQRVTALERRLEETKRTQRSSRALVAQLDAQSRKRWHFADEGLAALGATLRVPDFLAESASGPAIGAGKALEGAQEALLALFGPSGVAK